MKKHFIPHFIFIAYSALLIKVMVYKDLPTIKFGQLMLRFGGTDNGSANFIPFTTIVSYLFGNQGVIIAGVNLLGNVALLVPIGLLAPLVFKKVTWRKALVLSVATGLTIETLQAILQLGIFDVDDVILNGFGVMVGFWAFLLLANWIRTKKYKNIAVAIIAIIIASCGAVYALYPKGPVMVNGQEGTALMSGGNPCGNTKGTGQIVQVNDSAIQLKRNNGSVQGIGLTNRTVIRTSAGIATKMALRAGERVTVVVNNTETASAVLVCRV
ncbi:MAG TPA: VanZ family protein [Candidatus Saccharimonadales bacterium]|nr:VanZ family protein [Candidatus Saccharimonadales bacterium]